jgi:uncharacterized phage infection (PIP) family protein YhgE
MSDWTLDTLKEYLELALRGQDAFIRSELRSIKEAVDKALAASEKRFDSVNEFRNTLKDQQTGLITRTEADAEFRAMRDKIDSLTTRLNLTEGNKSGLKEGWLIVIGAVGLVGGAVGIISVIIKLVGT